ncbi:Carbon monoxide dehydrogenase large chain [Roseivivax sp. THAF40]|uniref:xanthine dehydrogenase family protein molybdopterin-binding subunit n=1 Tax=unclassified Roseivivax TaxID=2639302 RepID=UPI001268CBDA|nr:MULTISPECIES: xanthine dehydrogenase family protein molybdopterin-binding subunit [unclassified Roseivivax]QFS81821.1 Carbon monoxide dehydrogenase large chain [Roseivivax sp. THAF197b]QFT45621.1 Carbon monoxide dehydrogenase large chain [Roseivivax sp. THAF40]
MDAFGKSQPVTRREDLRLLTGAGRYTDDIAPEGALYGYFLRSPVAHGRIAGIDLDEAKASPGVRLILTAKDLADAGITEGLFTVMVKNHDGSPGIAPRRPILAEDKVRFVGEPMALIVAETLAQAKDAAELIMPDIEDLPVHLDLAPGGEALHDAAPDNQSFDFALGDEAATEAAFEAAAHVVTLDVPDHKIIANALEGRAFIADWRDERLHVTMSSQGVWTHKTQIAKVLGLPEDAVHVVTEDVGGGFGMKTMVYPEYFAIAQAARSLGCAVRWAAERGEGMLSDNMGRDLVSTAKMAFDADLKITGYRVDTRFNLGAYASQFGPLMQTQLFSRVLTGVYNIPTAYLRSQAYFTNTCQIDAYRGAGRPEAIYVLERLMDRAARELDVAPEALRQRNFIPPAAFPYKTVGGEVYDVGEFARVLGHGAQAADWDGFAARRAASEAKGRLRGRGLCYYIEAILGAPDEGVRVEFEEDGGAAIYVGTQSNGQGHETVFAQFLSDQTGIPVEKIRVVQGDSDLIAAGGGTGGSRSVTVQTNVTLKAVAQLVGAFRAFLAEEAGVTMDEVDFDDTLFRIAGTNETHTMLDVAEMARAAGRPDLLRVEAHDKLAARSFPNGCHLVEVEVDPETGTVALDRYTVVDDFGNLINPLLVEGQVHGGIAQGAGQVLMERVVYDETGQLLTASFMDYAMPRANDLPFFHFETEPVPSTSNPMGMKGCGEAGTVGAMAAVANAVQDALWDQGVRRADMPFTPHRVWEMLNHAQMAAE